MNQLARIQSVLSSSSLEAILLSSEVGTLYALGMRNEGTIILTPTEIHISVDGRYIEAVQNKVKEEELQNTTLHLTGGEDTHLSLAITFLKDRAIKTLAIEEDYLSVSAFRTYESKLPCTLTNGSAFLTSVRGSKSPEELALMRKAQEIADAAFTEILNFISLDKTEVDIAARLAYEMGKRGGLSLSFSTIVAVGKNGSHPHAVPGDRKLTEGSFLTMDFGCRYRGYCSDMTRTVAIGTPSDKMREVYDTVLTAQKAALSIAKAGLTGREIDTVARSVIEKAGYGDKFSHGLGHGIGVEIHEEPNTNFRNQTPLPIGAVASIEPGIYLAGEFGVRIEDVIILQENGCEILTTSPKELIILGNF